MAAVTSQAKSSQDNPLTGFGPNEWIVEEMYQRYLADPSSVDPAWHDFFEDYKPMTVETAAAAEAKAPTDAGRAGRAQSPGAPAQRSTGQGGGA
jgi:2-oxoglutarate decarboxylase